MNVIECNCATEGLAKTVDLLLRAGRERDSRGGLTLELPDPTAVVFKEPHRHILHLKGRNENPLFHLADALHMLSGRNDVKFLEHFNPRIGLWSDNGMWFNAAYGQRLRGQWGDQVNGVIEVLTEDPDSRQAVMQIWNPRDLQYVTKDKACNLTVVFRLKPIRKEGRHSLDMTVFNRSNDVIWGLFGSNVVQFSMLMMFVREQLLMRSPRAVAFSDIVLGKYTHVTNCLHGYVESDPWKRTKNALAETSVSFNGMGPSSCDRAGCRTASQLLMCRQDDLTKLLRFTFTKPEAELDECITSYFKQTIYRIINVQNAVNNLNWLEATNLAINLPNRAWQMAVQRYIDRLQMADRDY